MNTNKLSQLAGYAYYRQAGPSYSLHWVAAACDTIVVQADLTLEFLLEKKNGELYGTSDFAHFHRILT